MRRRLAKKILGTRDRFYARKFGSDTLPTVEYTLFDRRYMNVPPAMQKDQKVRKAVRRMEKYFANDPFYK